MKLLVIGGGGREHTLIWKLKQSPLVEKIYCAPGNAGIAKEAECLPYKAEDITELVAFAKDKNIGLTVVGPEAPLVAGIRDSFEAAGLRLFGPHAAAAQIEGSKVFAKELLAQCGVPTADFRIFRDCREALGYLQTIEGPCVVKADGLAAGKGVIVAADCSEAEAAVRLIMEEKAFGKAGEAVIIEELLCGEEVSVLAFTDGETILPMVASQDHKRVYDGNQGPNTGGMGAYSPPPIYTKEMHEDVCRKILTPIIEGMARQGRKYQGVLYAGLMLTAQGPSVLEFNCRFGDPETQAVIPRLRSDLLSVMDAVVDGHLHKISLEWDERAAVCVVLASGGYPGPYEKGKPINGLAEVPSDVLVFHAGTSYRNGQVVTSGGRVLGVTGFGSGIREAVSRAYQGVEKLHFEGMHYRRDIAYRALKREDSGC